MFAIRARRKTVTEKDFLDAVNKVSLLLHVTCMCYTVCFANLLTRRLDWSAG